MHMPYDSVNCVWIAPATVMEEGLCCPTHQQPRQVSGLALRPAKLFTVIVLHVPCQLRTSFYFHTSQRACVFLSGELKQNSLDGTSIGIECKLFCTRCTSKSIQELQYSIPSTLQFYRIQTPTTSFIRRLSRSSSGLHGCRHTCKHNYDMNLPCNSSYPVNWPWNMIGWLWTVILGLVCNKYLP